MRKSGILLPISSLPSKYGIGTLGREAYEFVDFLKEAGQKVWQILPVCPTSFGDSPYQSFSTFAGNPYFIDLDVLREEGLLKRSEYVKIDWEAPEDSINYGVMYEKRFEVLFKAFKRFNRDDEEYISFKHKNPWLRDYAVFMAIKDHHHGASFEYWSKGLRLRHKRSLEKFEREHSERIEFYMFIQYEFFKQWYRLKEYANAKGIEILGDCPIYVALDSADVWTNPKLFQLDSDLKPKRVAGCPPDAFSDDGQLWGNPLYDWPVHKRTHYAWWIERLRALNSLYDIIRIDHFIGFDSYYSIEYGRSDGREGYRVKGPGIELFNEVKKQLGDIKIIAEDLGVVSDSVRKLLKDCGYPGMRVLMFAFGDKNPENIYLPHNMINNCVTYIGTHDNEPIMAYRDTLPEDVLKYTKDYIGCKKDDEFNWDMIRVLESMVSDLSIIQCQDLLGLGIESRTNHPSTLGKNWKWRLKKGQLNKRNCRKLKHITELYGR